MHQRGWRQVPNYAMWAGVASFVKVRFSVSSSGPVFLFSSFPLLSSDDDLGSLRAGRRDYPDLVPRPPGPVFALPVTVVRPSAAGVRPAVHFGQRRRRCVREWWEGGAGEDGGAGG